MLPPPHPANSQMQSLNEQFQNLKSNLATREQMLTLDKNPFVWKESGNTSGAVGALSLAAQDGSLITVENLSEDMEVSSVATATAEGSEDLYLQNWILFCHYHL